MDAYCNKCGKCCKNIVVDFNNNIVFYDGIQKLNDEFKSMLRVVHTKDNYSICTCKFLKNNICSNPNKPDMCTKYPSSPFAFLQEDCGYEGFIFLKNEKEKQKIRKLKEEILHYEVQLKKDKSVQKIINHHQALIDKFKAYGSENW